MYNINNAKLGEDNTINLPVGLYERRKYTLWFDSIEGENLITADDVFDFRQFATNPDDLPDPIGEPTFAKRFKIPLTLKSRTGFFNVSVKSFHLGQNTENQRNVIPDPPSTFPPEAPYKYYSFLPFDSNYKVNIDLSSAYNGYEKDSAKSQIKKSYYELDYRGNLDTYGLIPNLNPIGSFQVNTSANALQSNIYNGVNPNDTFIGETATEPSKSNFQPVGIGSQWNNPCLATRCDDISMTIPDTAFEGNNLTIALSTVGEFVGRWDDFSNVSDAFRYSIPLLYNVNADNGLKGEGFIPLDTGYTPPTNFNYFNLPWSCCIQLEEC